MIHALRRWSRRVGLMPYPPLVCRTCGYRVEYRGDRRDQAIQAVDHFEHIHYWGETGEAS